MEWSDAELEQRALQMWANYIETGHVTLSANDMLQQNRGKELKPLQPSQQALIERLRKLAQTK